MANPKASVTKRWYSITYHNMSKVPDQIKELIQDEPDAKLEFIMSRPRAELFTALTWDFLRESLPEAVVGICDVRNREEEAKKI